MRSYRVTHLFLFPCLLIGLLSSSDLAAQSPASVSASVLTQQQQQSERGRGQERGQEQQTIALHRVGGAYYMLFDLYRLVLPPLTKSLKQLVLIGEEASSTKSILIPTLLSEHLQALHSDFAGRVAQNALPPLMFALHQKWLDALETLSMVTELRDIASPVAELSLLMTRIIARGQDMVLLEQDEARFRGRLYDWDLLSDQIDLALQELDAAQGEVFLRQTNNSSMTTIAQSYRRLEIALGHVLDLWAIARSLQNQDQAPEQQLQEEAHNTHNPPSNKVLHFESVLMQVIIQVIEAQQKFSRVGKIILAPPQVVLRDAGAYLWQQPVVSQQHNPSKTPTTLVGELRWQAHAKINVAQQKSKLKSQGESTEVLTGIEVVIEQRWNRKTLHDMISKRLLCLGYEQDEIAPLLDDILAIKVLGGWQHVATKTLGHRQYILPHTVVPLPKDLLAQVGLPPPEYRWTVVGPYGNKGAGTVVTAQIISEAAPINISAKPFLGSSADADFYRFGDSVQIDWSLSPQDLDANENRFNIESLDNLPQSFLHGVHYRLEKKLRKTGAVWTVVAQPLGGVNHYQDRLSANEWDAGVDYRVSAISGNAISSDAISSDAMPIEATETQYRSICAAWVVSKNWRHERRIARAGAGIFESDRELLTAWWDFIAEQGQQEVVEGSFEAKTVSLRQQWSRRVGTLFNAQQAKKENPSQPISLDQTSFSEPELLLSYYSWHNTPIGQRAEWVKREAGMVRSFIGAIGYGLRPWDVVLGFTLWWWLVLLFIGNTLVIVWWRYKK